MTAPYLTIRADANTSIGNGHFIRCLSLAQAWQDCGGEVTFLMAQSAPALAALLKYENIKLQNLSAKPGSEEDAVLTAAYADRKDQSYIVVDGYHFGRAYQQVLNDHSCPFLFIDDNGHSEFYYADIILNQNIHASKILYILREKKTRLLLGVEYALLRRQFRNQDRFHRIIPERAQKLLITMGGSDPANVTLKVIEAIQTLNDEKLIVKVLSGHSNPYADRLVDVVKSGRLPIQVLKNVNNMVELMLWADLAITAGGSTCYELACTGLPGIIITLFDNQRHIAAGLDAKGIAIALGWYTDISKGQLRETVANLLGAPDQREAMSKHGMEKIDARGSERVVREMAATPQDQYHR